MSNSTEMVELVARAIYGWSPIYVLTLGRHQTFDELSNIDRGMFIRAARSAIEAMREPTQQMRMAVWKLMDNNPALDRRKVMGSGWPDAICDTLISAALSPEDEGRERK